MGGFLRGGRDVSFQTNFFASRQHGGPDVRGVHRDRHHQPGGGWHVAHRLWLQCGRGIRIGSVKDGKVKYYIPDDCSYPYCGGSELGEGVTTDRDSNVYAADVRGDVRKFAKSK
jgi:hypothetical protein